MTAAHRKQIERRLLDERQQLTAALARYSKESANESEVDQAGDISKYPTHMADEGTDTIDQELEAVNAGRQSAELAEIDAALERLYKEPDQFGRCAVDGKEIPIARLEVIPWARTCQQHAGAASE